MPEAAQEARVERKFAAFGASAGESALALRGLPGLFRPAFPPRWVNSLYFDTRDLRFLRDSVEGLPSRRKIRLRWYGELDGRDEGATLELKRRDGLLIRKSGRALEPGALRRAVAGLRPVLLVRYRRRYFASFNRRLRITVDSGLRFYHPSGAGSPAGSADESIIEVKYAPQWEEEAREAARALPWRLARYSKYVRAAEALGLGGALIQSSS